MPPATLLPARTVGSGGLIASPRSARAATGHVIPLNSCRCDLTKLLDSLHEAGTIRADPVPLSLSQGSARTRAAVETG